MTTALVAAIVLAPAPKFALSVQAWTFNKFSVFEAIDKVAMVGGKNIELFPGQRLREDGGAGVGPDLSEIDTAALQSHLKQAGVRMVAFGVTGIPQDRDQARKLFRWAKRMGLLVINTESVESIDTIEALVKEFDIKVGFHNHPKRPDNPSYRVWDPAYVYSVVKNRDRRIGSCADTGHWVRSGIKPTEALKILRGRVVSSHLKDLNEFSPGAHDVFYGQGVSDVPGILDAFTNLGLTGPVSVEYEHNWDNNVVDVAACLGYVNGRYSRG